MGKKASATSKHSTVLPGEPSVQMLFERWLEDLCWWAGVVLGWTHCGRP